MKYKAGDRVRIKRDLSGCKYSSERMRKFEGEIMTVRDIEKDQTGYFYKMVEDTEAYTGNVSLGWDWYEDMIEGPAEPETSDDEVLRLAIETYGKYDRVQVCLMSLSRLIEALEQQRYETRPSSKHSLMEDVAEAFLCLTQLKMMLDEKEITENISRKTEQLRSDLEDEREVEVVEGKHSVNGRTFTWTNPDGVNVKIGDFAIADTKKGHAPIIVTRVKRDRLKNVGHHKKIVMGGEVWE